MALETNANILGVAGRSIPSAKSDGLTPNVRLTRNGDLYTMQLSSKQHALADEGSYFVTNNSVTGIAGPAVAAWTASVNPACVITNLDATDSSTSKRMYLDYVHLYATAAGGWASAGVNVQAVVVLDDGDRYSTGGTDLSNNIVSPNNGVSSVSSIAKVRFGNITPTAATGSARIISGLRALRPAVSATVAHVIGDSIQLNFGSSEAGGPGSITVASPQMLSIPMPPVVIAPGKSALIYLILNGTTPTASSYAPEIAWWER